MRRKILSAIRQLGPANSVHWSANWMKVAYVQSAHPSRTVIQQRKWNERNPNSPEWKDQSKDWTEYQEDQARNKGWKLHKELSPT